MIKRGLLLFMAILLVFISSSCFQNLSDVPDTPDEQDETENTLRIVHFSNGASESNLPRSIEYFEDPGLEVAITEVDSWDEASCDQLRMEMISGNSPDLLLNADVGYPCSGTLFSGLLMQDAFIELDPYLEQWEKLDELTLYPSITSCIDTGDTCVLLPSAQYMMALTTTSERMEQYGIELDQTPTIKEFKEQIERYLSKNPDGLIFPWYLHFDYFLWLTGADSVFVNKQNKTSSFDSEEFRTLIECYELISQHQGGEIGDSEDAMYLRLEAFMQNEALFLFDVYINRFTVTSAYETTVKEETGEQLEFYGFPMIQEGTYLSRYASVSGVLKNTSFPDQSVALLFDWFESQVKQRRSYYLSRSTTEKEKEDALRNPGIGLTGHPAQNPRPLSLELAENIMDLLDTVTQGFLLDVDVIDTFIVPCMEPYFDRRQTMDQCIDTLQNKVKLYLNE